MANLLRVRSPPSAFYPGGSAGEMQDVRLSSRRLDSANPGGGGFGDTLPDLNVRQLIFHHIKDWILIGFCIVVDAVLWYIHPFYRFVGENNVDQFKLPHKSKNTVPIWSVPLIAIGIPLFVFILFWLKGRNTRDFHHALLGLLTAVGVTAVFTDAIKNGIGRARPDFFYRCFPDGNAIYDTSLYKGVLCTGDTGVIREGHKSFPSGHTSWSFAGLGYLSFYLAGKLTFFDRRGFSYRVMIVLFPLLLAAMVAVSRVSDYWHHWQDVTVGGLMGFVIAYISYKQHFPDFTDKMAALPFAHIHRQKPQPISTPGNWHESSQLPSRANTGAAYDLESARM